MTLITQYIKRMAGDAPEQAVLCKVKSVDKDKCICDCEPVNGGAEFLEVRLRSIQDDGKDGLVLIPKVDSLVVVQMIDNDDSTACVKMYSEIEELWFKNVGGMSFEILKDVINLNGDQHGGLVMLKELKNNLDSVKKYVEAMNTALPNAFKAILASTSANGTLGATAYQAAMASQKIILQDMENKNVKHG